MEENKKNAVSEMIEKMLKFVCTVCEKEDATPAELEAMTRVANAVLQYKRVIN